MTHPVDHLLSLARLAERYAEPALVEWLAEGLDQHLYRGVRLDKALGLAGGQGRRTARRRFLERERNRALRAAWALCDGETDWDRSRELARQIRRFEALVWPHWQVLADPPSDASHLRQHLHRAFQCGLVPSSDSHVHDLCALSCE